MSQKPKAPAAKKAAKTSSRSKSGEGSGSGGMSQMSAMMHGRVTSGGIKSGSKGK